LDELRSATIHTNHLTRDDIKKLLQSMDLNNDSVLSLDEFILGMKQLYTEPEALE